MTTPLVRQVLSNETQALMARLRGIKPFSLHVPMVAAAALQTSAQQLIEQHMHRVLSSVAQMLGTYEDWLNSEAGRRTKDATAQRHLTLVRLRFHAALTQFDLFSDVLTQRSEHEFGVWLAGLDALAVDALKIEGKYFELPGVACYLDRGIGAAIRRVRTRLPGGRENPVAIIRVPRERMIGSGIASSLVHEVGHQGAALLNLVESLRKELQRKIHSDGSPWRLWQQWISEIIADFWSVAQIGVGSTLGLMGVVSLPRAFVFRISEEDPHPSPWIRVMLSASIGQALYPDSQWRRLREVWMRLYPRTGIDPEKEQLFQGLEATIQEFVELLTQHRPRTLEGISLLEIFPVSDRQPDRLRNLYGQWSGRFNAWRTSSPALAFAVIGQARADDRLSVSDESNLINRLLNHWAFNRNDLNNQCGCRPKANAYSTAVISTAL